MFCARPPTASPHTRCSLQLQGFAFHATMASSGVPKTFTAAYTDKHPSASKRCGERERAPRVRCVRARQMATHIHETRPRAVSPLPRAAAAETPRHAAAAPRAAQQQRLGRAAGAAGSHT